MRNILFAKLDPSLPCQIVGGFVSFFKKSHYYRFQFFMTCPWWWKLTGRPTTHFIKKHRNTLLRPVSTYYSSFLPPPTSPLVKANFFSSVHPVYCCYWLLEALLQLWKYYYFWNPLLIELTSTIRHRRLTVIFWSTYNAILKSHKCESYNKFRNCLTC